MKLTMEIVDDGTIDQRKLYRTVVKKMIEIINYNDEKGYDDTIPKTIITTTTLNDIESGNEITAIETNALIITTTTTTSSKNKRNDKDVDDDDSMMSVQSIEYGSGERVGKLKTGWRYNDHAL